MTRFAFAATVFFSVLMLATAALAGDVDIPGVRDCYGLLADLSECR